MKPYVNTALSVIIPILILCLDKQVNNHITYVISFIIIVGVLLWCFIQKRKQPYNNLHSFLSDKENYDNILKILSPEYINRFFKEFSYDSYWIQKELNDPLSEACLKIPNIKFCNNKIEQIKNELLVNIHNFISYKGEKTFLSQKERLDGCQTVRADEDADPAIYREHSEKLWYLSKEVSKSYDALRNEWRTVQSKFSE